MVKTKVLIADDHRATLEGIKAGIAGHPEFDVCGSAADGLEAIELARSLGPDIIVLDISMPKLSGLKAAEEIRLFSDSIRIVIFTMHDDPEYVLSLFKIGISAYVLKQCPLSDLILALKAARSGGSYFSAPIQEIVVKYRDHPKDGKSKGTLIESLSEPELEVFRLLSDGKTIGYIAESLFLSTDAVELHKSHIMEKLKMKTAEINRLLLHGSG